MLLRHAMMKQWVSGRHLIALEYHHEGVSADAMTLTPTFRRTRVADGVYRSVTRCRQGQLNFALPTSWLISIRVPVALMGMIASIRFVDLVGDLPLSTTRSSTRRCQWQWSLILRSVRRMTVVTCPPSIKVPKTTGIDTTWRQWMKTMVEDNG